MIRSELRPRVDLELAQHRGIAHQRHEIGVQNLHKNFAKYTGLYALDTFDVTEADRGARAGAENRPPLSFWLQI